MDGKRHGQWVRRVTDGYVGEEGPYMNGEKHGQWFVRWANDTMSIDTYVHGELQQ